VSDPVGITSVSPAPTVLLAAREAQATRTGEPLLSKMSPPTTVQAGIDVKVRSALVVIEPLAAVPKEMVWRAYDPPVHSVPAAESVPMTVTSAHLNGVV